MDIIKDLKDKLDTINRQIDELNAAKASVNSEIKNAEREEEAKRKAEQDRNYKALKDMVDAYNKAYNSNLVLAERHNIKVEDCPSFQNPAVKEFFKTWGIL